MGDEKASVDRDLPCGRESERRRDMGGRRDHDFTTYWAGLGILDTLSEAGIGLTSEEVSAILGTRGAKGIGSALSGTKYSLGEAGIRLDEAVRRRLVNGRTIWTAGPRIRQARHALEHARRRWTRSEQPDGVPVKEAQPGHPGPVLVLRALRSGGTVYRIDGTMAALDAILKDKSFEIKDDGPGSIGEIFIDRISLGHEAREQEVPEGYGENGIWVRGMHDYAQPRVAGATGTGRHSTMIAWIGEASWVERRIVLVDAVRQLEKVRAEGWLLREEQARRWHAVEEEACFRYVNWIGARGLAGPRTAPPLRMRLRCWYEIVIETAKRRRIVLREEGLRGDDQRTATRAINRWRNTREERNELIVVCEIRIAKSQPRPIPPRDSMPGAVSKGK